jgi:hypothetical protein
MHEHNAANDQRIGHYDSQKRRQRIAGSEEKRTGHHGKTAPAPFADAANLFGKTAAQDEKDHRAKNAGDRRGDDEGAGIEGGHGDNDSEAFLIHQHAESAGSKLTGKNNAQAKPGDHRHPNIQENVSLYKYCRGANDHTVAGGLQLTMVLLFRNCKMPEKEK